MAYASNISGRPTNGANPYIDSLVWGQKWIGAISYAFGPAGYYVDINEDGRADYGPTKAWTDLEKAMFRSVFNSYSAVCNITFVEEPFSNQVNLSEWSVHSMPVDGVSGTVLGQHDTPMSYGPEEGVFATGIQAWGTTIGSNGYATVVHEIGHALGLAHPHDGGGRSDQIFPGVLGPFDSFGDYDLNQSIWTVMSYNSGWDEVPTTSSLYGNTITPMALDIAALQQIYGANYNYNTGNQTYLLPTTNTTGTGWSCIWDAGGIDTISASSATGNCEINLNAAQLFGENAGGFVSHESNVIGGFTIANGVVIENALGGRGSDRITGNSANNLIASGDGDDYIIGKGGNDTIDGGGGIDIAHYYNTANQYQIAISDNKFRVTDANLSSDGADVVTNVERLYFSDYKLILDQRSAIDTTVYQIYQAAFSRMPDTEGFIYWANAADEMGLSALDIARSFVGSQEFALKYGFSQSNALVLPDNSSFINRLYTNALGRASDTEGLNYWVKQADAGRSREQLLLDFATSPENVNLTGAHTADHIYWTVQFLF